MVILTTEERQGLNRLRRDVTCLQEQNFLKKQPPSLQRKAALWLSSVRCHTRLADDRTEAHEVNG